MLATVEIRGLSFTLKYLFILIDMYMYTSDRSVNGLVTVAYLLFLQQKVAMTLSSEYKTFHMLNITMKFGLLKIFNYTQFKCFAYSAELNMKFILLILKR